MLLAGDELGRTQRGSNNAYCQDNDISWVNWDLSAADRDFFAFVQRVIALRRKHPVFHRRNFFQGRAIRGSNIKDIQWLNPDGKEMSDEEWAHDYARCLGVFLSGAEMDERDARGRQISDENFLLLFNSHHEPIQFQLPIADQECEWQSLLDTHIDDGLKADGNFRSGDGYPLEARSLALLMQRKKA